MNDIEQPSTCFASALRASAGRIKEQHHDIVQDELLNALMQSMPGYAMLLNHERQIVAANKGLLDIVGVKDVETLLGNRPGEILNCIHLQHAPGGCGTSAHCSVCGAVLAILESQNTNSQVVKECRITSNGIESVALDMQAVTTPILFRGEQYIMLALRDISSEKRREVLERVFFHDVINTAGGIFGLASLLTDNDSLPDEVVKEYQEWLVTLSGNLLEEIHGQRKLLAAEQGTFVAELAPVKIHSVVSDIYQLYRHHEKTPGRELCLAEAVDCEVVTDASVLRRIIGNMTINALEATPKGGTVTLAAECDDLQVTIKVHNPGMIPPDIQLQLFNRSFSTKGDTGRGIGTYSMKLFGERYLKGRVSFRSNLEEGTTFSFSLPLQ